MLIGFGWPTEGVLFVMMLSVAAYFVQQLTGGYGGFTETYWLEPTKVVYGRRYWQLATHLFLHDPRDLSHLLFNLFALWMFGPAVEVTMGGSLPFLLYFLFTGMGAGLLTIYMNYRREKSLVNAPPSLGASGAIYGLLIAYAVMLPDAYVPFILPPAPIPARLAVIIVGALTVFAEIYRARSLRMSMNTFNATASRVNHLAHLGGLLFGLLYFTGRVWLGY